MLEDIAQKGDAVTRIIEQLGKAAENGNHERFKELIDMGYAASLEQSSAITGGINFIRDSLERKDITEEDKKYLREIMKGLQNIYSVSAMELRLLTIAGQKYGLTNAPEG